MMAKMGGQWARPVRLGSGSGPSEKSAGISAARIRHIGRIAAAKGDSEMCAGSWLMRRS
jgi:hypothetical protein